MSALGLSWPYGLLAPSSSSQQMVLGLDQATCAHTAQKLQLHECRIEPRPCVHAGTHHHADGTLGRTQQAHDCHMVVVTLLGAQPPGGTLRCARPAHADLLTRTLNSPTRDTALQPLCVHVLAREVLEGIRPETVGLRVFSAWPCPTTTLSRLLREPRVPRPGRWAPPVTVPVSSHVGRATERCVGMHSQLWEPRPSV